MNFSTSILIPTYKRPFALDRCLRSLSGQTVSPSEVIVAWQADDEPSRAVANSLARELPIRVSLVHSEARGVVPAENVALNAATGEIVMLLDDDAVAPPDWVAKHIRHYQDPRVGAVGGPARNFHTDGTAFPHRTAMPVGVLRWTGRPIGNMYDHPPTWRMRPSAEVDHLVGYNMSIRRTAFGRFESSLREYWQLFELDLCLQAKAHGYRVLFDYSNMVEHYPTNTAYTQGRGGDLQVKIYNAAYNHGFIVGKHFGRGRQAVAALWQYYVGSSGMPGFLGMVAGIRRYGSPVREWRIRNETWSWWVKGRGDARCGVRA